MINAFNILTMSTYQREMHEAKNKKRSKDMQSKSTPTICCTCNHWKPTSIDLTFGLCSLTSDKKTFDDDCPISHAKYSLCCVIDVEDIDRRGKGFFAFFILRQYRCGKFEGIASCQ